MTLNSLEVTSRSGPKATAGGRRSPQEDVGKVENL